MLEGRRAICKLLLSDLAKARSKYVLSSPFNPAAEQSPIRACCSNRTISSCRYRDAAPTADRASTVVLHSAHTVELPRRNIIRIAKFRTGEIPIEPTYGVGPVGGADRDPKTRGSVPDDFRADDIHMAEPKEVTKAKAAIAQQEPPDFEGKKTMPQWEKPFEEKAEAQRESGADVFEGNTRKVEGTAQKQGTTTGNEAAGQDREDQYGATPSEGKTGRS